MSQNTSSAVMQQRQKAPPDALDFFPTPAWATRALVEHVIAGGGWRRDQIAGMTCWEPACGEGHMARPLAEYFKAVLATDVANYGFPGQLATCDFTLLYDHPPSTKGQGRRDWIITNPPFRLASEFIDIGLKIAKSGIAMLVRTAFLEGKERYYEVFSEHPPAMIAPFAERVPMFRGRIDQEGSSATSYCWMVWSKQPHHAGRTIVRWIPPCRGRLERVEDYVTRGPVEPGPLVGLMEE